MSFNVHDRVQVVRDSMQPDGYSTLVGKEGVVVDYQASNVLSTKVDLGEVDIPPWFADNELKLIETEKREDDSASSR